MMSGEDVVSGRLPETARSVYEPGPSLLWSTYHGGRGRGCGVCGGGYPEDGCVVCGERERGRRLREARSPWFLFVRAMVTGRYNTTT